MCIIEIGNIPMILGYESSRHVAVIYFIYVSAKRMFNSCCEKKTFRVYGLYDKNRNDVDYLI